MKSWLLAGILLGAVGTAAHAADRYYWVVGNRATNKCPIVTSNPIIIGDLWFEDGPYKSLSDARLARSTISVCPKENDPSDPE